VIYLFGEALIQALPDDRRPRRLDERRQSAQLPLDALISDFCSAMPTTTICTTTGATALSSW